MKNKLFFLDYETLQKSYEEIMRIANAEDLNNNNRKAIALYTLAIEKMNEIDKHNELAYFLRGKLNIKIKNYKSAIYDLGIYIGDCLPCTDHIWDAYFLRCIANLLIKNEIAYIQDWTIIQSHNKSEHLFFLRGLKLVLLKNIDNHLENAFKDFDKVIEIDQNFFQKYYYLIVNMPDKLKAIFNLYSLSNNNSLFWESNS